MMEGYMGELVQINGKFYKVEGGEYLGIEGHYSPDRLVEVGVGEGGVLTPVECAISEEECERIRKMGKEDDMFFLKVVLPICFIIWLLVVGGIYGM